MPDHILVAVAWPYANGPRHVGHVAGFGVPSDIFARYHRLKGNHVLMVSGTDEHGTPITLAADKEGVTPKQLADRYSQVIGDDLRNLGLSYDTFTRTTTQNHYAVTQDLFKTLYDKGYILKKIALGAFSAATGRTLPDRYVEGTCPICGYTEARGDQCDNCGNQLDPVDLINPRSKVDGQPPVFKETEHFFLDLSAFAERLAEWIDTQSHWRPNVRSFSLNLLSELRPRAITRDLDWGVPIPLPEYAERDDKRIYVWFDAVIGYLSASVEWAKNRGTPDAWREWWQNPQSRHYYFMGKDNIVFHSVIWPSMLMGYGNGGVFGGNGDSPALNLPYDVVSSEFLTMEGKKFSSSRGIVIYVNDVLSRYDADPLRYFLTIGGPETQDTDFTWAEFVRRNNDELVATWGNLVNRTLTNVFRNFGAVPQPGALTDADTALIATVEEGLASVGALLEGARFKAALGETMKFASQVNQYLSEQEPWKVIKIDRARAGTVLYTALRCVDTLKIMFTPFLPFSSQKLHELLGYEGFIAGPLLFREYTEDNGISHRVLTGDYTTWAGRWEPSALPVGQVLRQPAPLFKKLDEAVVAEELARLEQAGT
ncbi:MAG TPA: methionine--tRNA ligase [Kouleothrix sp.]|nr:methionine--tRNA ligase [Kouleothrix sp.]